MPKYTRLPLEVTAELWDGECRENLKSLPSFGRLDFVEDAHEGVRYTHLSIDGCRVRPGLWLVDDGQGNISRYKPTDFLREFIPMEEK